MSLLLFFLLTGCASSPFKPYSYDSSDPKVVVGMSKEKLLATFGAPFQTVASNGVLRFAYDGEMCEHPRYQYCFVYLKDGVVASHESFKPEYSDDLK
jgi:hypothetical protein